MNTQVIERIEARANRIKNNLEPVISGMPVRFTEASTPGDVIHQGDLILKIIDKIPEGYVKVMKENKSVQLVPGNTEGAKHCLDLLEAVDLYYPTGWPESAEVDYLGPVFVVKDEVNILHPVHKPPVGVPSGFTVQCGYQRELDAITKRERRNAD